MRLRNIILALGMTIAAAPQLSAQPTMIEIARAKRWAELHVLMIGEMRRDGRDLRDAIRADFSTLEIAIRRTNDTGFTRRILTNDEIDKGDLSKLAARIVADSTKPAGDAPEPYVAPASRKRRSTSR
jgi:hypothetical protein